MHLKYISYLVSSTISWVTTNASMIIKFFTVTIAACGLLIQWKKNAADKSYQRSASHLNQIKDHLKEATLLLSHEHNNNIQWHHAIDKLKTVECLKDELTEPAHKHTYLIDLIDFSFKTIETIKRIPDFKFFYGLKDYADKSSQYLFESSLSRDMAFCHRISPESLASLACLLDKASRIHWDLNEKKTHCKKIFTQPYFRLSIAEGDIRNVTEFTKKEIPTIFEYINDYKSMKEENGKKVPA